MSGVEKQEEEISFICFFFAYFYPVYLQFIYVFIYL